MEQSDYTDLWISGYRRAFLLKTDKGISEYSDAEILHMGWQDYRHHIDPDLSKQDWLDTIKLAPPPPIMSN